jgi:hypothetical protein
MEEQMKQGPKFAKGFLCAEMIHLLQLGTPGQKSAKRLALLTSSI